MSHKLMYYKNYMQESYFVIFLRKLDMSKLLKTLFGMYEAIYYT